MKQPCFQKIQLWLRFYRKNKKKHKGALTVLSVFLFLTFTTLGLGMLYLTQVYLKISAYRKNTMLLEYASENGIKQGYDHLHDLLSLATSPILLTEEEASHYLDDSSLQGSAVVQRMLENDLPIALADSWERFAWESLTDFQLLDLREEPEYFHVDYMGKIASTGKLQGFKPLNISTLDSRLELLVGHIPLPAVPFLLDKSMTPEQRRSFLVENDIHMIPSDKVVLPPSLAFSDGGLLPEQAGRQLAKALKIKIFHPQDLSAPRLRLALGLEVNNEPVPDGVYLIQDDIGLGGVFVQGDCDEMILAIQGSYQIISFRQGQDLWVLRFSPEEYKTTFISPVKIHTFDLVPFGIIIVNGKILSLGGGYADADGRILMAMQEEIPSVLRGVQLTIISSDEVTLSSHLIYQGVTWKEGVPYLNDSDSQLIIQAVGHDFLDGEERAGEIVIDENSSEDLKVHASISASGKGVTVLGEDKKIQIMGSLQTSDLAINQNEISIKFDERIFHKSDDLFQDAPHTNLPVLYLFRFRVTEWREIL